jgi:hypothetical protein
MQRRGFFGAFAGALAGVASLKLIPKASPPALPIPPPPLAIADMIRQAPPYRMPAIDARIAREDKIIQEFRTLPQLRGSVIRFRRDPSKVFEL